MNYERRKVTPHKQTYFYGGNEDGVTRGNCWQTVIASVLDLPLESVPHFVDIDEQGGENWWSHTARWLGERGYAMYGSLKDIDTDEYQLVTGKSPRGNFYHVVVYQNGNMIHDPHPSNDGILSEDSFVVIRKL